MSVYDVCRLHWRSDAKGIWLGFAWNSTPFNAHRTTLLFLQPGSYCDSADLAIAPISDHNILLINLSADIWGDCDITKMSRSGQRAQAVRWSQELTVEPYFLDLFGSKTRSKHTQMIGHNRSQQRKSMREQLHFIWRPQQLNLGDNGQFYWKMYHLNCLHIPESKQFSWWKQDPSLKKTEF